jgi:nickel/cobalt transporter (NicO) family protein
MGTELTILLGTAASLGLVHTLIGPDHYLPFVMMARIGNWSMRKTALVTFLCGIGHILSSVALAFIGIGFGVALSKLKAFEAARGELAAWLLIAFGFTYAVYGLHLAIKARPHEHLHDHGEPHTHPHTHTGPHSHVHSAPDVGSLTPWVLFTIFVFGPCECLIPLLMYAAAVNGRGAVALAAGVFGATTILTMLSVVIASSLGVGKLSLGRMERYSHALAGLMIFACGGAIKWLGL